MSFDIEVAKILRREGGYVNDPDDRGGETNFGISKRANPDIDIANLTAEQAVEVYRERYWNAADIDSLPEHMQGIVFDAAVNHGVGAAKQMLARSGGDYNKFYQERVNRYSNLVQSDPSQRKYAQGWANRMSEFAVDGVAGQGGEVWNRRAYDPGLSPQEAWQTRAAELRAETDLLAARRRGGNVRNPMGEAAKDYIATVTATAGGDVESVYSTLRGQEAAAAEQLTRAAGEADGFQGITDEYYEDQKARQAALDAEQVQATLREQYSYLWRETSATGALVASFEDYSFVDTTPDPGLRYIDHMHEWEKGRTVDEIKQLRRIGRGRFNREMIEDTIRQQDLDRERAQVMRGAGMGRTLGLSLVAGTAGDPLGMLAGYGAFKGFQVAGFGARQALMQGKTARAFALGGAEAAVGNVAVTKAIDSFGKQQSAADYAMAAGFGFALGMPFVGLEIPGVRVDRAREYFHDLAKMNTEQAAARMTRFNEAARSELGDTASADQIAARASELEQAEVREHFERILSPLPDEDMLAPRMPEADAEVPTATPQTQAAPEGTADAALGDMYRRREGDLAWSESRELRAGLEEAEATGRASAAVRAVANDTGASPAMRELARRVADALDETDMQYIPNASLEGDPASWAGAYFRDTHQMSIKMARADIIMHEALHGVTSNIIATPKANLSPEMRAAVTRLDDLRDRIRVEYGMEGADPEFSDLLNDPLGPLSSSQEFLTYAMTDTSFQRYLASRPSPDGALANAWQWFKDLIGDMLGLTGQGRTALDDALEASGQLVDLALADSGQTRGIIFREAERVQAQGVEVGDAARQPPAPDSAATRMDPEPIIAPTAILRNKAEVDAMAKKYGLDVAMADPVERALSAEMYARAERILANHPIDEKRLRPLLSAVGMEATSTRMLLSKNPLMRATAVMLMENPEGAAGRQVSAALISTVRERAYRSVMEPEYDSLLEMFAAGQGKGRIRSFLDPRIKEEFNNALSREMHSRWMEQGPTTDNQAVLRMADVLDEGYRMMGAEFQAVGALGSSRLPVGKSGFFPRSIRGDRVAALTAGERRVVTQMLSDEFQVTAGFDRDFADELAVKYLERAVDKASNGWMVTLDLRSADTADTVRDALTAMGFSESEMQRAMGRYSRGGAGFTKSRIDLDMNVEHTVDGQTFRLADLFENDHLALYKNYARRVSGEVALTQFGIMGSPGMKQLRNAITKAPAEWQSDLATKNKELEAFDQWSSEMLGTPFGTRLGRWADNTRALTSASFLGGMGFTQLGESANGLHAVGAVGVLRSIAGMPRLLREARAIGRGEKVDNPILKSIEVFNGEIGADQYRIVGLRDADRPEVYGSDQLGTFSLAARGASHAVRVMSMQRAIEAVQVRGFSEQIVRKAMRYIRDGREDAALTDMGITPQLREAMQRNMNRIAKWQGDELVELDLSQMDDVLAARAFAATVDRGASQIIQRTYPGEVGRWAHDDHLLLLTQFRSYPLVATQKQWRRVAFSQGTARAIGYIIGSASIVLPIYLARTALQGVGKDDDWWEQKLSPVEMARAMSRYTSSLGLTSDVIDAVSPLLGLDPHAGRSAATGTIPAISFFNQVGQGLQGDPYALYRSLPGNNIPFVQAGMQALFSD